MSKLAFDIETIGEDFDKLDETTQEVLTRWIKRDSDDGKDYKDYLNPHSVEILGDCRLEPCLAEARPGDRYQFERLGYFCVDTGEGQAGMPVFNRSVTLRDEWAKIKQGKKK